MIDFDIFIDCNNDLNKIQNVLEQAKNNGFVMASDFDKNIPPAEKLYIKISENTITATLKLFCIFSIII